MRVILGRNPLPSVNDGDQQGEHVLVFTNGIKTPVNSAAEQAGIVSRFWAKYREYCLESN